MKIPEEIQIVGTTYKVNLLPKPDENNSRQVGNIHFRRQEIRISDDVPSDTQGVTFWHETLHAIFQILNLNECETEINDALIDSVAHMLYQIGEQVIKANKMMEEDLGDKIKPPKPDPDLDDLIIQHKR